MAHRETYASKKRKGAKKRAAGPGKGTKQQRPTATAPKTKRPSQPHNQLNKPNRKGSPLPPWPPPSRRSPTPPCPPQACPTIQGAPWPSALWLHRCRSGESTGRWVGALFPLPLGPPSRCRPSRRHLGGALSLLKMNGATTTAQRTNQRIISVCTSQDVPGERCPKTGPKQCRITARSTSNPTRPPHVL